MAAGTGSIQTRKDRRLKFRARYWHNGKQYSKSFERKTDAQLWLRNELSKLDNGSWLDPNAGRVTVREWSEEWSHGLTDQKPKTLHGYQSLLRSRVLPEFGDLELRQVTPAQVRKWMTAMSKEGLSNARSRQARQVLFSMYEVAVADGLVGRNPVAQVKAPSVRRRRQLFLTADQVSRLANASDEIQEGMGMLIRFAAYSGCRWGETVALRRSSVSKDGRRVRIKEAATEVGGRLEFGTPKTHEVRTVLLPKFVAARLAEHIEDLPRDALVFTTKTGGPLRGSNHRRSVWVPACEASKMPATLLFHDLRDTAASLMISAGASIKAIQRQLGHASASMTLDTYGSLFESDLEDLVDRLDAKFSDADVAPLSSEDERVVQLPL